MTQPTAGWYPDPANGQQKRWWDGAAWTEHTQAPPAPAPPVPAVYMPTGDILPAAPTAVVPPAQQWAGQPQQWTVPAQSTMPAYAPQAPVLASRSYAAPLSFVGSTRRMTGWARRVGSNTGAAVAAWITVCCVLPFMWMFVLAWYAVVFGLFGVFTFPYRLMRRSQRKSTHLAQAQLAATQAMLHQQQQR